MVPSRWLSCDSLLADLLVVGVVTACDGVYAADIRQGPRPDPHTRFPGRETRLATENRCRSCTSVLSSISSTTAGADGGSN